MEKFDEILHYKKEILKLTKKAIKILQLPKGKRNSTMINRAFKVMAIMFEIDCLKQKIMFIKMQPIPKKELQPGGIVSNNSSKDIILSPDDMIVKPSKLVNIPRIVKIN